MGTAQPRPGRHKAQCGGCHGTAGLSPQGQRPAVSVETGGRGEGWLLWGLQCKRAEGTRSTGLDQLPRGPWESPQEGCMGPGRTCGQSPRAVRQAWATEGTMVVSGRAGLGRHVDVPERDGAAGGLVAEQQGWRACVCLCPGTALLCTGLGTRAQALGQDLLDGPAQVWVQSALRLAEDLQGEGLECAGAEVFVERDGVHAGHLWAGRAGRPSPQLLRCSGWVG